MQPNHKLDYFGAVIFRGKAHSHTTPTAEAAQSWKIPKFFFWSFDVRNAKLKPQFRSKYSHSEFYEELSKNYCETHPFAASLVPLFIIHFRSNQT